jgi:hypothetical protein
VADTLKPHIVAVLAGIWSLERVLFAGAGWDFATLWLSAVGKQVLRCACDPKMLGRGRSKLIDNGKDRRAPHRQYGAPHPSSLDSLVLVLVLESYLILLLLHLDILTIHIV